VREQTRKVLEVVGGPIFRVRSPRGSMVIGVVDCGLVESSFMERRETSFPLTLWSWSSTASGCIVSNFFRSSLYVTVW
jgi:hypothetical protein